MKRFILLLVFALAACGPGNGGNHAGDQVAASPKGCALLADAASIFGKDAVAEERSKMEDMAGACHWESKDGALIGEMVTFTPESLGKGKFKTAQARYDDRLTAWKNLTFDAPKPLESLGDQAQLWTGFGGGQSQVIVRKGESVLIVSASSIDAKTKGDDLAQKMAAELVKGL